MTDFADRAAGVAAFAESRRRTRLAFVDNVRSAMTALVLGMHAAVTYSPFGRWFYVEHRPLDQASLLFFATFQATLQAFFMALLFFLAGVFVPGSYDRKGAASFLGERLWRLGAPTLLFVAVIGPVTEYFIAGSWRTRNTFTDEMILYVTRLRFLSGTGPLWFCVALLVFSAVYAFYRRARPLPPAKAEAGLPTASGVVSVLLAMTAATFLVRIVQPVGTAIYNMQLCFFASYAILFALGIAAGRGRWLERVSDRFAWTVAALCLALAAMAWLPLLVLGGAFEGHLDAYNGGLAWQSLAMAAWESLVCVGMSFAVLAGFRALLAGAGRFARFLADNAFAVYVIHPPVLVLAARAMTPLDWPAVPKFALLWGVSLILTFGLAAPLARRVPGLGRILD
jgi:hypothetical protein